MASTQTEVIDTHAKTSLPKGWRANRIGEIISLMASLFAGGATLLASFAFVASAPPSAALTVSMSSIAPLATASWEMVQPGKFISFTPVKPSLPAPGSTTTRATNDTVSSGSIVPLASGTWVMLQVGKLSALTYFRPSIDAALAIPGVRGLSLRAPWSSLTSSLAIYDQGVLITQADHSALALRFLAGVDTPPQFIGNGTTMGGRAIPLPWGAGTTTTSFVPNTVFETAYGAMVRQLAAYSRVHGIHLLHLPWFGGPTAEIYNGPEVQSASGYSLQNFLTGYERLVAIGMSVTGPDLGVEFPLGGVGTGKVVLPIEAFMAKTYGANNPALMVQYNDLTDALPGPQHPANGVNMIRQMQGQGDYNWANVYQTLIGQNSRSVEIYLQSFAPSLAHAALLRQETASYMTWAGG